MKGIKHMKKQNRTTTTVRATIEFTNLCEVLTLENALATLLKGKSPDGEKLTESERKEIERLVDLVESLTGDTFLNYWLAKHN